MTALLQIENLCVEFANYQGVSEVLDRVSLSIDKGEIFGLVGESGCGKSVTARAILGLIPEPPGKITQGAVYFEDKDLLTFSKRQMRKIRGAAIAMIFQEPMSSLNPVFKVGNLMREVVRLHRGLPRREAEALCIEMLRQVQMPDAAGVLKKYPHELSGGMRQRVMIAMVFACDPKLLIADEPTTALDVTVQGQVLAVLTDLSRRHNTAVMMITHDMGVVAQVCDRVAVMYAGRVMELASVRELFANPLHPYTKGLIASIPDMDDRPDETSPSKTLHSIPGTVPTLINPPPGCRFHPRCQFSAETCQTDTPRFRQITPDHAVACHLHTGAVT